MRDLLQRMIDDPKFCEAVSVICSGLLAGTKKEEVVANAKANKTPDPIPFDEHYRLVDETRKRMQAAIDAEKKGRETDKNNFSAGLSATIKEWESRVLKEQQQKHEIQEEKNKLGQRVMELSQTVTKQEAIRRRLVSDNAELHRKVLAAEQKLKDQAVEMVAIAAGTAQADQQVMRDAQVNASAAGRYRQSLKKIGQVLRLDDDRVEDRADLSDIIQKTIQAAYDRAVCLQNKVHSLQSNLSRLRRKEKDAAAQT